MGKLTNSSKTIGQLRSGVIRRNVAKATIPAKSALSRTGIIARKKSTLCSLNTKGGSSSFSTSLPLEENRSKRGGTSKKPSRCSISKSDKYRIILERCPAERALRVKRVRPDTIVRYADSVDDFLQWAQSKRLQVKSDRQADKAMARYFDQVFEDGCPLIHIVWLHSVANYS